MSYKLTQQPAITVMGIHTRASNAEPYKIGDLWRRYHAMGDHEGIAARLSDAHYGVYCEYEGDHTQPFTVVIGCEVPVGTAAAEGMRIIEIPAGEFAVYKPVGKLPDAVFETWAEIWKTPLDRTYQADYDRYDAHGATVHVGVR